MSKDTLNSLNQKYIKQNNIEKAAKERKNAIKDEMVNDVLKTYHSKEDRDRFVQEMEEYHFSEKRASRIIKAFENFNQDNISYNVISDLIDAQAHIKERKRESLFSKVSNIIPENKSS